MKISTWARPQTEKIMYSLMKSGEDTTKECKMRIDAKHKLELRRTRWKEIRAERVYEGVESDSMNAVRNSYLD